MHECLNIFSMIQVLKLVLLLSNLNCFFMFHKNTIILHIQHNHQLLHQSSYANVIVCLTLSNGLVKFIILLKYI